MIFYGIPNFYYILFYSWILYILCYSWILWYFVIIEFYHLYYFIPNFYDILLFLTFMLFSIISEFMIFCNSWLLLYSMLFLTTPFTDTVVDFPFNFSHLLLILLFLGNWRNFWGKKMQKNSTNSSKQPQRSVYAVLYWQVE